jgi:hypothetical protein
LIITVGVDLESSRQAIACWDVDHMAEWSSCSLLPVTAKLRSNVALNHRQSGGAPDLRR